MTKLLAIGVMVAVFLIDAAPAFAHYRGYRAYGYYGPGFRAYGYYGYRPYRYIPAEQRHWYDRNTAAFNT
jgi:hypothetical protein